MQLATPEAAGSTAVLCGCVHGEPLEHAKAVVQQHGASAEARVAQNRRKVHRPVARKGMTMRHAAEAGAAATSLQQRSAERAQQRAASPAALQI